MSVELEVVSDSKKSQEDLRKLRESVDSIRTGVDKAAVSLKGFAVSIVSLAAASGVASMFVRMSDDLSNFTNKLKIATDTQAGYNSALKDTRIISANTRQDIGTIATLYQRMSQSAKILKANQNQIAQATQNVSMLMTISAANTQESAAAITQLGQALASGKLQGDELRSLTENAPALTKAIADALGVTIGQLRALGEAGKLTSEEVFGALIKDTAKINAEFKKISVTYAGAFINVGNAAKAVFAAFSSLSKSGGSIPDFINKMAVSVIKFADNLPAYLFKAELAIYGFVDDVINAFMQIPEAIKAPIEKSISYVKKIFDNTIIKYGLTDSLSTIKDWGKQAENVFFTLYDKVIGHSWIPDLVVGVIEWTKRLTAKPVEHIKEFADKASKSFSTLYSTNKLLTAGVVTVTSAGFLQLFKQVFAKKLESTVIGFVSGVIRKSVLIGVGTALIGSLLFLEKKNIAKAKEAAGLDDIQDSVSDTPENSTVFSKIKSILKSTIDSATSLITKIAGAFKILTIYLSNWFNDFRSSFDNFLSALNKVFENNRFYQAMKQMLGIFDSTAPRNDRQVPPQPFVRYGPHRYSQERPPLHDVVNALPEGARIPALAAVTAAAALAIIKVTTGGFFRSTMLGLLTTAFGVVTAAVVEEKYITKTVGGIVKTFLDFIHESIRQLVYKNNGSFGEKDPFGVLLLIAKMSLLFEVGRRTILENLGKIAVAPAKISSVATTALSASFSDRALVSMTKKFEASTKRLESVTSSNSEFKAELKKATETIAKATDARGRIVGREEAIAIAKGTSRVSTASLTTPRGSTDTIENTANRARFLTDAIAVNTRNLAEMTDQHKKTSAAFETAKDSNKKMQDALKESKAAFDKGIKTAGGTIGGIFGSLGGFDLGYKWAEQMTNATSWQKAGVALGSAAVGQLVGSSIGNVLAAAIIGSFNVAGRLIFNRIVGVTVAIAALGGLIVGIVTALQDPAIVKRIEGILTILKNYSYIYAVTFGREFVKIVEERLSNIKISVDTLISGGRDSEKKTIEGRTDAVKSMTAKLLADIDKLKDPKTKESERAELLKSIEAQRVTLLESADSLNNLRRFGTVEGLLGRILEGVLSMLEYVRHYSTTIGDHFNALTMSVKAMFGRVSWTDSEAATQKARTNSVESSIMLEQNLAGIAGKPIPLRTETEAYKRAYPTPKEKPPEFVGPLEPRKPPQPEPRQYSDPEIKSIIGKSPARVIVENIDRAFTPSSFITDLAKQQTPKPNAPKVPFYGAEIASATVGVISGSIQRDPNPDTTDRFYFKDLPDKIGEAVSKALSFILPKPQGVTTEPLKRATGGHIRGPGTGTSDSIPAMLSHGEFVINAKATRENRGLLEKINSGNVKHLAQGGIVEDDLYNILSDRYKLAKLPKIRLAAAAATELKMGRSFSDILGVLDTPDMQALLQVAVASILADSANLITSRVLTNAAVGSLAGSEVAGFAGMVGLADSVVLPILAGMSRGMKLSEKAGPAGSIIKQFEEGQYDHLSLVGPVAKAFKSVNKNIAHILAGIGEKPKANDAYQNQDYSKLSTLGFAKGGLVSKQLSPGEFFLNSKMASGNYAPEKLMSPEMAVPFDISLGDIAKLALSELAMAINTARAGGVKISDEDSMALLKGALTENRQDFGVNTHVISKTQDSIDLYRKVVNSKDLMPPSPKVDLDNAFNHYSEIYRDPLIRKNMPDLLLNSKITKDDKEAIQVALDLFKIFDKDGLSKDVFMGSEIPARLKSISSKQLILGGTGVGYKDIGSTATEYIFRALLKQIETKQKSIADVFYSGLWNGKGQSKNPDGSVYADANFYKKKLGALDIPENKPTFDYFKSMLGVTDIRDLRLPDLYRKVREPESFASGGHIRGPGSGTSDSIPAMLSNGEFVVNAEATKRNRGLLDSINSGKAVSYFAQGTPATSTGLTAAQAIKAQQVIDEEVRKLADPLITQGFVAALMKTESAFNPSIMSNKGAVGLMQLIPGTARQMGLDTKTSSANYLDPNDERLDIEKNIRAGIKYLGFISEKIKPKSAEELMAGYNAGPDNVPVLRKGGVFDEKGKPDLAKMATFGNKNGFEETSKYITKMNNTIATGAASITATVGQGLKETKAIAADKLKIDTAGDLAKLNEMKDIVTAKILEGIKGAMTLFGINVDISKLDSFESFGKFIKELLGFGKEVNSIAASISLGESVRLANSVDEASATIQKAVKDTTGLEISKEAALALINDKERVSELSRAIEGLKDIKVGQDIGELAKSSAMSSEQGNADQSIKDRFKEFKDRFGGQVSQDAAKKSFMAVIKDSLDFKLPVESFNSKLSKSTNADDTLKLINNETAKIGATALTLKDLNGLDGEVRDNLIQGVSGLEEWMRRKEVGMMSPSTYNRLIKGLKEQVDQAVKFAVLNRERADSGLAPLSTNSLKAGQDFASSVNTDFTEGLTATLRGTKTPKAAIKALVDSITGKIVDMFAKSLSDALFKGLKLDKLIGDFASGIAQLGEDLGNKLAGKVPGLPSADPVKFLEIAKSNPVPGPDQEPLPVVQKSLLDSIKSLFNPTPILAAATQQNVAAEMQITAASMNLSGKGLKKGIVEAGIPTEVPDMGIPDSFDGFDSLKDLDFSFVDEISSGMDQLNNVDFSFFDSISNAFNSMGSFDFSGVLSGFLGGGFGSGMGFGMQDLDQFFAEGGIVRGSPGMAVPVTAHAGELILNEAQQARVAASMNNSSQQVFNVNVTGDISRQTKSEIVKMLPQIASGVNSHNREINHKR